VKAVSSILLVLFGLPFLVCGGWLLARLGGAYFMVREIRSEWVRVPATIMGHETITIGSRRPIRRPTVRYAYEFGGARYETYRHDLLQELPVVSRALGRTAKLPYEPGATVSAFVDPKAPIEAVLSLELQYAGLIGPAGILFLLIGVAFVLGPPLAAWRRSAERRDRASGLIAARWETSQGGLAVLVAVAVGVTAMIGLVMTEARAWSVPAAILVAALAAGSGWLFRLFLRERSRRRPFAACRLRVSGAEWTLLRGGLASPSLELALREETRSMGEDGPGPWKGTDLVCTPLGTALCTEGWRGTFPSDEPRSPAIDELLRRRIWLVRVRDGAREAVFPL